MKNLTLLSIIVLTSLNTLTAQNNIIKGNLLSPIFRTGSFFFERTLDNKNALQLGFFYTDFNFFDTKFRGFGITPEYRYYAIGDAPSGFYVAPFFRYQNFSVTGDDSSDGEITLTTLGGGLLIGVQWLIGDRISFDAFIGPCFNTGDIEIKDGSGNELDVGIFEGAGIRTGLTVGVAF